MSYTAQKIQKEVTEKIQQEKCSKQNGVECWRSHRRKSASRNEEYSNQG